MADFLASFNLGADDGAPPQPSTCASIEGLQLRLAATLADKSTETRVEHVSTSLDICATTHLTVSFSMEENGVLEALSNLDPSLGGLHSTSVSVDTAEEQAMRKITASDALTNQPQDDPVLQRAVAKLIISAVSATDSSTWVVRDMSRGPQGWNFTYICDNSFQQWNIQNKGKTDAIIGEYTLREPDPVLMSRPAYDCRGTIKIAFSRGARSISIKYDHTPLHRTVAEAAEYFKPPPRPVMVRKANKQKSPKKQGSARKKRESTKALDENGNPKKRKRNNKGQAQQPAALTEHEQQQPQLVEPQQNDQQTLQVADGSAPDPTQSAQGPSFVPPGTTIPLNLSPEEATRRRDVAVKLLSDAGVDPATLSTEQFNIFANQSPDLQRESLNMLVKYGAERLRIVHPSNRDSSASVPPTATPSLAQSGQGTSSGAMTTKGLALEAAASAVEAGKAGKRGRDRKPGKSRNACKQCKSRKVKCPRERPTCAECQNEGLPCEYTPPKPRIKKNKSDATVPADYDAEGESQPDQTAPDISLGGNGDEASRADITMDEARGDGDPEGEEDETRGEETEEQLQEVEEVQEDEEEEEEELSEQEDEPQEEPEEEDVEDAEDQGGDPTYSSYPQVPVSEMLAPSLDMQSHETQSAQQPSQTPYFRSASGLALPQPEEPPVSSHIHSTASGLVLPQATIHYPSSMAMTAAATARDASSAHRSTEDQVHLLMAPQAQQQAKNLRRSLPAGPSLKHGRDESSVPPLATPSGWSDLTNPIRQTAEGLSAMRQRAADEPASRGAGHRLPTDSVQLEDAIALSQAALEHQRQAHGAPAAMQPSAMHASSHPADDSRSQSRQAQRAQTATPREMQVAAGAFQSQPAAEAPSMSNANSGSHYRTTALNVNDAPIFSNYSNYPDTLATASNDRIGYEPYSYHKSSSNNHGQNGATYSSYDYGRTSTASTVSMEDAAMTTMASAYPANSLSVADPLSSSRGHNNSPGRASLPYDPPDARRRPSQLSTSSQDFGGMRSAPQQAARPSHGQVSNHRQQQQQQQPQQPSAAQSSQSYSRSHHHQPQQHQQHQKHQQHQQSSHQQQSHQRSSHHHQQPHQQPSQGQNWYSFSNNPNSTSYAFGVPRPNYNWKLPDESWGGMS